MTRLRLLADDLTGALDTVAELVPLVGEVPVVWRDGGGLPAWASLGLDSGTRESEPEAAMVRVAGLVECLDGADIAFKKIDSLLRGATIGEIAACVRSGRWQSCILAPAFPYQGRVTRAGRQYARSGTGWVPVSEDLVSVLVGSGIQARMGRTDAELMPGVQVFDADSEDDLLAIAAIGRRCQHSVLWIGTGGLAQALAAGHAHPAGVTLPRPLLGLFGSDQAVTARQLAACRPHWIEVAGMEFDAVSERLDETGVALVSFRLEPDVSRATAAGAIASAVGRLTDAVPPPSCVVVAGGETLRTVCDAVGADRLLVRGRLVPGVPVSVIQGGRWHGVTVVSKSGAFGHSSLLRELILEAGAV